MTTASPPAAVSSSQFDSASSHVDYDTTVAEAEAEAEATAAAAAPTELPPPPSTEDPHDECVLCCYPLPLKPEESTYHDCCGEVICDGCSSAQARTLVIGTNVKKPIKGSKEEELEFMKILCSNSSEVPILCPFCRAKKPTNDKESLKRIWKRIDEHKDPKAMIMLGGWYENGKHGLSKNIKKVEELFQQAYDLGDLIAARNLFVLYTKHFPDQQARIMKYLEEGARKGNTQCNNCLGLLAAKSAKHEEAKRHLMTAARSGHEEAMRNLMISYQVPGSVVSKEDLATTLRAHKAVIDQAKSAPREYAIRLKVFQEKMISTGKMKVVGDKDKRKYS